MFTLEEANSMLPRLRRISRRYFYQVERLKEVFKVTNDLDELRIIEHEVNSMIKKWIEDINRLCVEAKGLWMVAFDSGDGIYFLWEFDEPEITYYCTYDRPDERIPISTWTKVGSIDSDHIDKNSSGMNG